MGGGSSSANRATFDMFRSSFTGHFIDTGSTKSFMEKFATRGCPCLSKIDGATNKMFLVTEGSVEVCIRPVAPGAVKVVRPVDVSTLLSSCRTLRPGDMYAFFGGENPELLCVSSATVPSRIMTLSQDHWRDISALEEYRRIAEFSNSNIGSILQKTGMFSGLSDRELDLVGALMELRRIDPGQAVTDRGRPGDQEAPSCAIYLDGELVELSDSSNYLYPVSSHSLHKIEQAVPTKGRRMSATGRTTCAELELQDIANIEGGFRSLVRGDVVGGDLCFFPGMAAPSTVVARRKSIVGILSREALLKLEKNIGSPLESRMRPAAILRMLTSMKSTNVLLRILSESELAKISQGCTLRVVEIGQTFLKENEEVHSLFHLQSGNIVASSSTATVAAGPDSAAHGRMYPFSLFSPALSLQPTTSTDDKRYMLSAGRKFCFPIVSAVTPMSSGYNLSTTIDDKLKNGGASKIAILEIPQQILDEAVFQGPFEAESTACIGSAVDDVDFIHVLRHKAGFNHLHEYLRNERSTEGIYFWKAVERYSILMSRFQFQSLPVRPPPDCELPNPLNYVPVEASLRLMAAQEIALTIIEHYVNNGSFFQVNIPHTHRSAIDTSYRELAEKTSLLLDTAKSLQSNCSQDDTGAFVTGCNDVFEGYAVLFAKAKHEVYLLMREDSFKRWRRTEGFSRFIMDVIKK